MKISVCMTAFNAGDYIGGAIESVLGQTCGDFELIIVDDGSSDETAGSHQPLPFSEANHTTQASAMLFRSE